MTVSTTTSRVSYAGNGVTVAFSVPFPFIQDDYLVVVRTDTATLAETTLTLNSVGPNGYSVTGAGQASGTVTVVTAPTGSQTLTIVRAVPSTQEADFVANDPFPAEVFEDALDKLTMIAGQVTDSADRSLKLFEGDIDGSGRYRGNGNRIVGIADGESASDAATVQQVTGGLSGSFVQAGSGSVVRTMQNKVRESVSVLDFGAVGDGVTDDTAAFEAALTAAQRVFVPASATPYRVDNMTIPSGRVLYGEGAGSVIAPFTVGAGDVITLANGATDIYVFDLAFNVDPATYAAKEVIGGTNNSRVTLRDLRFDGGGAYAINLSNQQQTIIQRVRVDGVSQSGILLFTADQCQVNDCVIQMQSGALAGVDIYFGTLCKISGCNVENAGVFGYHLVDSDYCSIVNNTSWNTDREGINLQNSSNNTVVGNTVAWDGLTSLDFGISVYAETSAADSNLISDNTVIKPFKSGITIDGSLFSASGTLISGNKIYDCNIEDDATGSGILLFGANVDRTHVVGNYAEDTIGKLRYAVNAGGASTLSTINGNRAIGALLGVVDQDNGDVAINGEGSRAFTPVVAPGSGAFNTIGAVTFSYYELEKMVFFRSSVTITTNGTAATSVIVTLPFVANGTHVVAGRESAVTGLMLQGSIISGTSNCVLTTNDAVYPGGDGRTLIVSGWYERA